MHLYTPPVYITMEFHCLVNSQWIMHCFENCQHNIAHNYTCYYILYPVRRYYKHAVLESIIRRLTYMASPRSFSMKQLWRSAITWRKILFLLMWEVLFKLSWGLLIENNIDQIFISVTKCLSMLLAPLVGLLADVKFGRYEIIKTGSLVAFFASLFYYCALVLGDASLWKKLLFCAATILVFFGETCYATAMLPFLSDQVIGASSDKLSAAIRWYYWAKHIGFFLCDIILYLIIDRFGIKFGAVLFFAVPLAVIIISDCLCQQWLDRTHKPFNPIKLITQVLNYTRKHSYPERRSAFTYIDEEQPTRMDYGKSKFGGPFTEEEVEDVKTVLRLIPLIICFCLFVITLAYTPVTILEGKGNVDIVINNGLKNWLSPVLLIPFYQFLVRPCIRNRPSMLRCIGVAMVMCAVGYMLLATSAVVGVVYSHDVHSYLSCTHNISQPVYIVHWYWKIGPLLLYSIGKTIVYVLKLEFIIAQSPDNMKGFVLGLTIAVDGIIYLVLVEAVKLKVTLCYDLQALVVLSVLFVVFVVLSKCYTLRERNREINIQAIVEEHYQRYMDQEEEYRRTH